MRQLKFWVINELALDSSFAKEPSIGFVQYLGNDKILDEPILAIPSNILSCSNEAFKYWLLPSGWLTSNELISSIDLPGCIIFLTINGFTKHQIDQVLYQIRFAQPCLVYESHNLDMS